MRVIQRCKRGAGGARVQPDLIRTGAESAFVEAVFDVATRDRRELLLDKDRLHHLGLQFEPSWATGNLLRDMQTPPKAAKAGGPAE